MGKESYFFLLLAATLITSGCAPKDPLPSDRTFSSSHIPVPFVPPRSKLCASTSIEMVASYWQTKTSYQPYLSRKTLDDRTLIPAKEGTLQIELIATARANGLLVYPLEPTLDALFSELKGEHPVIVLINRGYAWYPFWHYAPITGYDANQRTVMIHFADRADEAISVATFAALWERSGNWGVVLVPPDHLPATAMPNTFLRAAYDLETTGLIEEAIIAYQSALLRWPDDVNILLALANAHYRVRHITAAEQNYRKLLMREPTHSLALNNLADLLCHTNRSEEALNILERASTDDVKMQSIIKATKAEIEKGCTFY